MKQGVFLRDGGVSVGPYQSLNISDGVGDKEEAVLENRLRVQDVLGVERLYFTKQVHGKELFLVDKETREVPVSDGLLTKEKNLGLAVQHADCQAAIFYDKRQHVLATAHAGWRGNVLNIYKETVERLKKEFESRVDDLLVCIAPSLGPDHSEFIDYKRLFPKQFWPFQVRENYFDLWQIARFQLESLGIPGEQIEIASLCTYCYEKDFFSYRRDKVTGRNVTVALLL
ncbi:MAG: peptidoglycan editing factor PgeF [Verrucomicrobia bacterium]|nr:peptidoglycan editing factor PgeF [Verrucomicrobiota bacterium]